MVGGLYCAVLVRHRRHFPRPRWYFHSEVHFHPIHIPCPRNSVQHLCKHFSDPAAGGVEPLASPVCCDTSKPQSGPIRDHTFTSLNTAQEESGSNQICETPKLHCIAAIDVKVLHAEQMKVYSMAGDGGFYSVFAMADWGVEQRLLEMANNQARMAPKVYPSYLPQSLRQNTLI